MKDKLRSPDVSHPSASPSAVVDLDGIKRMLDDCQTSNKNDLVVIAIEALIGAGVNIGPRIIGAARSIGFDPKHAGAVLGRSEGRDPGRHRWQRDSDGVYRLHSAAQKA